ncbi:MAG: class I SAM-dependent methyltransferase [Prevotellaceae bacterium]|jgi:hypothetical protein|nr:class I SAM-dependent methyltransferase [Prevotellaceae bacterium]
MESKKTIKTTAVQVDSSHYDFAKYVKDISRWNSYWHQITETMSLKPENVLVVGIGDGITGNILSMQGIKVSTFDFDEKLHPDFTGNVAEIDKVLQGKHFDVLLCCQLLEHLPYDFFEGILQKMKCVADNVIISLPYSPRNYYVSIKLPLLENRKINIDIHRYYSTFKFNGEHYWEIGWKGYRKQKIRKSIEKYFSITKCFTAINNRYHLFFVLK